jgi:hypothetical protein
VDQRNLKSSPGRAVAPTGANPELPRRRGGPEGVQKGSQGPASACAAFRPRTPERSDEGAVA